MPRRDSRGRLCVFLEKWAASVFDRFETHRFFAPLRWPEIASDSNLGYDVFTTEMVIADRQNALRFEHAVDFSQYDIGVSQAVNDIIEESDVDAVVDQAGGAVRSDRLNIVQR